MFVGQLAAKQQLRERIFLARQSDEPLPHLMLVGPSEMGKATCARAIAAEMGVGLQSVAAENLKKHLDVSGVLTHINRHEVLLVEDIELLRRDLEKTLLEALSEGTMELHIGTGPNSRLHTMEIRPFTMIATTCKPWQLTPLFRRWFLSVSFEQYSPNEIAEVLLQLADSEGMQIERSAAELLAIHCRGTPGNALTLLKRIRAHYRAMTVGPVTTEVAEKLLHLLGYDAAENGNVILADRLRTLSGLEFEQFVAEMFRLKGYNVELTAVSRDHGIDLMLKKQGRTGAVQCKRWTEAVGEPVVRDFLGAMIDASVTDGFIATTSAFTDQAWKFADAHGIRLLDLDSILGMAGNSGEASR